MSTQIRFLNPGQTFEIDNCEKSYRNLYVSRVSDSGVLIRGEHWTNFPSEPSKWSPLQSWNISCSTLVNLVTNKLATERYLNELEKKKNDSDTV